MCSVSESAMITECWTPQSNHRDTFFSIYVVHPKFEVRTDFTCNYYPNMTLQNIHRDTFSPHVLLVVIGIVFLNNLVMPQ